MRQEGGAEIAGVASGEDSFGGHHKPRTAVWLPPTPAGLVERDAGIGKGSIPLLRTDIEVLWTDAQDFPAFVLKQPVLRALDRHNEADRDMRLKPVLDRLLGLIVVRRQLRGFPCRLVRLPCLFGGVVGVYIRLGFLIGLRMSPGP